MRKITQTVADLRDVLTYDPVSGEIRWRDDGTLATVSKAGKLKYLEVYSRGIRVLAHRLAWFLHYGYWPPRLDHRDTDGSNNRLANLRVASPFENAGNSHAKKPGYKGVSFDNGRGKWLAQIMVAGRTVFLGRFADPEDAARAYDDAAPAAFGDFARGNFS